MDSNSHQSKSKNKTEDTKTVKNNCPATTTKEKQTQMAEGRIPLCPDGDEPYQILSPSGKPENAPSSPKVPTAFQHLCLPFWQLQKQTQMAKGRIPLCPHGEEPYWILSPSGRPEGPPSPPILPQHSGKSDGHSGNYISKPKLQTKCGL